MGHVLSWIPKATTVDALKNTQETIVKVYICFSYNCAFVIRFSIGSLWVCKSPQLFEHKEQAYILVFKSFPYLSERLNCIPNPCKNDGACFESGQSFRCVCPKKFTGKTCSNGISYLLCSLPHVLCERVKDCIFSLSNFSCQHSVACSTACTRWFC